MIKLAHFFEYYANRQNEFQTGWQLVGQSFTIITFETFAMVFCAKFNIVGIPAIMIYLVAPIAAVISVIYLGHKMIRSGYAHEFQRANMNINKDWSNHLKESAETNVLIRQMTNAVIRQVAQSDECEEWRGFSNVGERL